MKGRIIRIISKNYTVLNEEGEKLEAVVMGRVRLQRPPVVGDIVDYEIRNNRCGILSLEQRKNRLIRPACANIDQALIVMSVKDPDFSPTLIDRLTFLIVHENITPVLIVTKCDLGIDGETEERIREYEAGPMQVVRTGKNILPPELAGILKGKISVLTGQSGAGKSSLLNGLEPSFHLATQEISKALGRGRHTTRHSELHEVAGGLVADTPGFSSLDFSHMSEEDLRSSVLEFAPYEGKCRFNDCRHENEPGCAIKQAVEQGKIPLVRYRNYIEILDMIHQRKARYDL